MVEGIKEVLIFFGITIFVFWIVLPVIYGLHIAIENRIFDREFDRLQKEQDAERGTFEEELARIEASKKIQSKKELKNEV